MRSSPPRPPTADITVDQLAVASRVQVNTNGATGNATVVNATALDILLASVGGNLVATATTGGLNDGIGTVVHHLGRQPTSWSTSWRWFGRCADQRCHRQCDRGQRDGAGTVGGTASFTAANANDVIVVDQLAVTGSVDVQTNGATGDATVVNATVLDLDTSAVGGNLDATATTGNVTDSGVATVGGTASFTAANANDDILVDQLAVTGSVDVQTNGATGNATVVNATVLDLDTSAVGGNLDATATTGNVTDSGVGTVGGTASFTAANANDDILVDQLAVTGSVDVQTNGATGNATVVNATVLDLDTSAVGGNLDATATTGNVTDSGVATVGGTASFTAANANDVIVVDQLAVTGSVDVQTNGATGNATVVNATVLDLDTSAVGGNLDATATTGNVTDSGVATVGGTASFTTSAANDDITGRPAGGDRFGRCADQRCHRQCDRGQRDGTGPGHLGCRGQPRRDRHHRQRDG